MAIKQITTGDGRTVTSPSPDKKNVIRPDVAYIMDDMMKDVVNRGTAAQLGGWGFRNVEGKTAFAGKTGTSRDGWFAGFTPEIVCVVYVGFDDGSDLGMKGGDSAMPIWADFMKEAMNLHPDWNGDWQMPAGIRRAEIDIRNGALVRELDNTEADLVKQQQDVLKKNANTNTNPELAADDPTAPPKEVFVTEVPAEFRRVELFIGGTVPNKAMIPLEEGTDYGLPEDIPTQPTPTPPPVTGTWQDSETAPHPDPGQSQAQRNPAASSQRSVTVMVCKTSGMRATNRCPEKEAKVFKEGTEPKDFCDLH